MKRILILVCMLAAATPLLRAQEIPTETRAGELQIGGGYSSANPDYSPHKFYGPYLYSSFDFRDHIGVEFNFHYVKESNDGPPSDINQGMYERTYEIGPRYVLHIKKFDPFVKVMIGRGVFNYPDNTANLAYNMYAAAIGCDLRTTRYLNVRLFDYEYQKWSSFPPNGLQPNVLSFGVAYRFH